MNWAALFDDPRLAVLAGAIPSAASGMLVWWRFRIERKDKMREADETRDLSRDERRSRDLDKQQETLSAEQQRWVADLRQENKDLRKELRDRDAELTETKKDRDQGWKVARWWYGMAHELLRLFRNLRHNALNMMQIIQSAVQQYPTLSVSSEYISPIPDRPDLPLGLEDIPDK
jgi:predicted RNase H-like nuclease (RuvC/YqgF family)